MYMVSSQARNKKAGATSFGWPGRPIGVSLPNSGMSSGFCPPNGLSGVQMGPGATAFTRMPFLTRFFESERVNAVIAPLVALEARWRAELLFIVTDVQLMITDPAFRCGSAAWTMKNIAKMLVWKVRFS